MLSANQTWTSDSGWSIAANSAKYCRPVATRAASVAPTSSAGRLPEPSSSMAKWSRWWIEAGSAGRSSQRTIRRRGGPQKKGGRGGGSSKAGTHTPPAGAAPKEGGQRGGDQQGERHTGAEERARQDHAGERGRDERHQQQARGGHEAAQPSRADTD